MPISDEEAYKQGKRIAEDMQRGTYSPSKDYSDKGYGASGSGSSGSSNKQAFWIVVAFIAAMILIIALSR
jgi:hypothetical protein